MKPLRRMRLMNSTTPGRMGAARATRSNCCLCTKRNSAAMRSLRAAVSSVGLSSSCDSACSCPVARASSTAYRVVVSVPSMSSSSRRWRPRRRVRM
jgi:hypothetical protein